MFVQKNPVFKFTELLLGGSIALSLNIFMNFLLFETENNLMLQEALEANTEDTGKNETLHLCCPVRDYL